MIRGMRTTATVLAILLPAMACASSGEFQVWVSRNNYDMQEFNQWLHGGPVLYDGSSRTYSWTSRDPYVRSGLGIGAEYGIRWGRWLPTGLDLSAEFLVASAVKNLGPIPNFIDEPSVGYETFNLSLGKAVLSYSGALPVTRWLALEWGAGMGVSSLLSAQNHTVTDDLDSIKESDQFRTSLGRVWEIAGGPTFALSGRPGWVLSLRAGYRNLRTGPIRSTQTISEGWVLLPPAPGSAPWNLDYSGVFFRIEIGGGNIGKPLFGG